jgi:hypothetical protein
VKWKKKGLTRTAAKPLGTLGVYDLEWHRETLKVTHCGVRDASGYRCHKTVEEMLQDCLSAGGWWFAHAGGSYDMVQLFPTILAHRDWHVTAAFSGVAAVIVRIRTDDGREAAFGDSAMLLKAKLADIGKIIGLDKGNLIEAENAGWKEVRDYNERDCEILYVGLHLFERRLQDLGGQLRPTLASCAMALFRASYLSRDIRTNLTANQLARLAYTASRVEIFRPSCTNANYYDINSSFPFSMTFPCPGEVTRVSKRWTGHELALVEATVTVPECYLPPLPVRVENAVYHPTGTWQGWYSGVDLIEAKKAGATIERVHRAIHFAEWNDLTSYARDIYDRRLRAKKEGNKLDDMTYKLLANGLYGKFAENPLKEEIVVRPPKVPKEQGARMVMPGVWSVPVLREIPHEHVAAPVIITSRSRHLLRKGLARALEQGEIYYCDTDSVICQGELPTGEKLGEWKLETRVKSGQFLAPKLYAVTKEQKDASAPERIDVRAKGFRGATWREFLLLAAGEVAKVESFSRVRGMLAEAGRTGELEPKRGYVEKRWLGTTRPKRCPDGENNTRAWTIDELREDRGWDKKTKKSG